MSESESVETPSEIQIDVDALLKVATDRLVWIRLLEKAVNDIDGVLVSLKNDIAEISASMQARDGIPQEAVGVVEDDEQE